MTYNEIIARVSEETGLPKTFVNKVYKAYWRAIRQYITSLPLKEDMTDEEFAQLQPNINIPSLGKFFVTLDKYKKEKKKYNKKMENIRKYAAHKENQTQI